MPTKKGTSKAQTPKKAKRIIRIKRKTSEVVESVQTPKIIHEKKKAPRAGIYSFIGVDGNHYDFTAIEYKFADLCVGLDKSPFQCVLEAGYNVYDDKGKINKGLAWSIASENLSKPKFQQYINKQLESVKLNKEVVMLELAQLLVQKFDSKVKVKAMDIYFKLTGEYAPEKHQHSMDEEITEALSKVALLVGK